MAALSQQLDLYLNSFRERLRRVSILRGSALLALALLLISLLGAWLSIRSGFASDVVFLARLVLLISLAGIVYRYIFLPLQQLERGYAQQIERHTPAFAGRVETYAGMQDPANPFRELLAEDALILARNYPPERQINNRQLLLPAIGTGVTVLVLLWLLVAGPGLFNYAIRHLWAGWMMSGLLPPQVINVTPGNEAVRRGGNIKVLATMQGFEPTGALMYVRTGETDWQQVEMIKTERGYEFTFFSLREPVNYYVTAAGIRSPEFSLQVVDLPELESLKLTYHYPEWTHKAPDIVDPGGDIRTIIGTGIELEVHTTTPLPAGVLVVNGDSKNLQVKQQIATGQFEISEDGQYYVAARVGSELVRLTDDYFIKVMEDGKPEIKLSRPGRDWNASSIEEVTVHVQASDDFSLESMQLRYAVNGGEWQSVPLPVTAQKVELDHVLLLEAMQSVSTDNKTTSLQPGDLITYYAEAKDKDNTSSTDMFFIQVQPFDRRYTQSQQAGGGGGQQGNEQQEISQRQKEIIVSTWNLMREKATNGGVVKDTTRDNALLLSGLQKTLAEQAQTLAERTRARELNADEQVARFVEHMDKAAQAMAPATENLAGLDLEAAIRPEQEALQHLLRAEAVFTDMQVSFQQNQGGGGGGGRAGQDLAEMFELEMDLKKNQYETGSPATPEAEAQQTDDSMDKLEELARRQEQLANNLRNQQNLTDSQRWQQEMLKREAERLREQLDRQQQASNQQGQKQGAQGQQGQPDQQSTSNNTSDQSEGSQGSEGTAQSESSRRLQSAIRAMNDMTEAMRDPAKREQLERAAEEAGRQLEGARDQISQDQQQSMQQSFAEMSNQADRMYDDQISMEQQLQEAVKRALATKEQTGEITSGLTPAEQVRLSEAKKAMAEQLQQLQRDMQSTSGKFGEQVPEAQDQLDKARDVISQSQLEERLNVAAEYIAYGAAPYIAGSESTVTNALEEIGKRLRDAETRTAGADIAKDDNIERALAQTRSLRQQLEQLANPSNQNGQAGQESGQQTAQQPSSGQEGQSAQSDMSTAQTGSQPATEQGQSVQSGQSDTDESGKASLAGGLQTGTTQATGTTGPSGQWGGYANRGPVNPADWDRYSRSLMDTARAIRGTLPELSERNLNQADLDEIRDLTQQLEQQMALSDPNRNDRILQQQLSSALSLLEQLELKLDAGANSGETEKVRTTATEPVPDQYKDAVAEYYRRLSQGK